MVWFIEMTISHQGTDAAMFEYIRVMSTTGVNYQCDVDQIFIDDEQYLTTDMCFILWLDFIEKLAQITDR